jgi:CHAT domain-containing protein
MLIIFCQKAEGRARPRIHWCPAGDFAHVPLHAAGLYRHNDQQTTESCSDFVVSSYTPTLTALINARRNREAVASNSLKALLIGEGAAPGFTQIPCSIEEIKMVHDILHERSPTMKISVEGLDSEKGAQIQPVLTELQEAAIVHFACHGQQHPDPLESSFRLRDGPLTLSALMRLKLPKAYFAFLSACETAQGDISLQDQPIHLAAAMLFTGFKSVIASMWYV